jgi:uncharacterized protein
MIIDSHTHISYLKRGKQFSKARDDLLASMKKNGIDYSMVIPDNLQNSACADLETVIGLIKNESKLYALGTLKITEINKANLDKIEKLYKKKVIRGFKIFPGHDPVYPTDKRWFPVYKLCEKYNFPLMIHTGVNTGNEKCAKYNDPKHIIKIAKLYPKLNIIIAHYFWPKLDYCFSITNGINNIYFDTSALADSEVVSASGGIRKIKEILIKTIERKSGSVLFGSDWPMCNVKKHIDLINSLSITREERQRVFYKNSLKLFRLPQ